MADCCPNSKSTAGIGSPNRGRNSLTPASLGRCVCWILPIEETTKMRHFPLIAMTVLCLCFLILVTARAQTGSGTITGTVTDPNGAVIAGAVVTATNKATNLQRTVSTNDEGMYVISNLPVGPYDVTSTSLGFQTLLVTGLLVRVGQTLTTDIRMSVAVVIAEDYTY